MAVGNGGREAYTANVWGVGLSHEKANNAGAETVGTVEATCAAPLCEADALPGSKTTSRPNSIPGTWEIPRLTSGGFAVLARIGKA